VERGSGGGGKGILPKRIGGNRFQNDRRGDKQKFASLSGATKDAYTIQDSILNHERTPIKKLKHEGSLPLGTEMRPARHNHEGPYKKHQKGPSKENKPFWER